MHLYAECLLSRTAATAHTRQQNNTRSCAIEQMTAQCAPYMGALKIFGTPCPWLCPRATATFPTFFMGFCLIDPINVCANFKVRSFTRSWDKGYPKNLGSPGYAHALYPPKKSYMPIMCTRFPAILDCSFEWRLRTPNLREGEAVGGRALPHPYSG